MRMGDKTGHKSVGGNHCRQRQESFPPLVLGSLCKASNTATCGPKWLLIITFISNAYGAQIVMADEIVGIRTFGAFSVISVVMTVLYMFDLSPVGGVWVWTGLLTTYVIIAERLGKVEALS